FRDRALLRRRHFDLVRAARFQPLAHRGRPRRPLFCALRPDPRRLRRSVQPPKGRRAVRGHRLTRPGLLMSETAIETRQAESPRRRLRRDWARRLANELLALFIALLFLLAGLLVLLDSAPGHRFIIDQLSRMETQSGLRIRIGRIDGSIFGKSQLRNVTVAAGRGVFLTSPNIKLDWTPGAWLDNKLHVDSLTAERVNLIRLPNLKPPTKKGPILPGFDIHIGELRIDRLDIGAQVGGKARSGSVRGKADVNHGRALVELAAVLNNGRDRIPRHPRAQPDRNRFDMFTRVIAPADGLVPALIGTK